MHNQKSNAVFLASDMIMHLRVHARHGVRGDGVPVAQAGRAVLAELPDARMAQYTAM